MINKDNQLSFVQYFQKRLSNLDSKEGTKFREDYEAISQSRLTRDKANHLSALLDNALGDIESQKLLEDWAGEHVSPAARRRFLTAQRQKKAKAKRHLVTLEATEITRFIVKTAAEGATELQGLKQPELLELLVELGEDAIRFAKKDMSDDVMLDHVRDKLSRVAESTNAQ